MRRAAYSVPANIAEGFARRYRRSRLHFLNIAEGSLAEVGYCLHAARRLGYISDADFEKFDLQIRRVNAPLTGLIRAAHLLPIFSVAAGTAVALLLLAMF